MRPELQAKLLQHLNKKKAEGGFTLVELLVVVIIIGILAAIALPSYLNLTASSKQSEARQHLSSINHAQQVFFTENSSGFTNNFDTLALGVVKGNGDTSSTSVYEYKLEAADTVKFSATALPLTDVKLKRFAGGVESYQNTQNQQTWASNVCEATASEVTKTGPKAGATLGVMGALTSAPVELGCPTGSKAVAVAGKV